MQGGLALKLVGLLAGAGVFAFTASTDSTPVPVKASARNEVTGAAGGEYFAWAKSRRGHPRVYDVWAQHGTEAPFKVNPRGTSGWGGGIDGTRLAYQEVRYGWQSDIRLFDLAGTGSYSTQDLVAEARKMGLRLA